MIAKLDRLSRGAHFLLGLEKAGVEFVAVDMPNANRLTVRLMAVIAQEEREMIAARTKAALAPPWARGVRLGGWKGGPIVDHRADTQAFQDCARAFTRAVGPDGGRDASAGPSLRQIAAELVAQGIRTSRGGAWSADAVRQVLIRVDQPSPTERTEVNHHGQIQP